LKGICVISGKQLKLKKSITPPNPLLQQPKLNKPDWQRYAFFVSLGRVEGQKKSI
jgi:hypothetical protein